MKHRLNRFLLWLLLPVLGFAVVVAANGLLDTQESVRAVERVSPDDAVGVPGDELLGELVVHYLEVGQADATLLQGPDFTILIDAGHYEADDVVPYLHSAGVEALDLLVGTHPHADHIGQIPHVLAAFEVREVWMSGDAHTTRTFERVLDAILASDADYHEPRAGEVFDFGSAQIQVVNPERLTGDLHEGSVSLRIRFGDVTFVFTGDAEAETEQAMIARGHDLRGTVLQLGHHGSRTSSTEAFLQAVSPAVAIYSAGEGNPYGHPHNEVMARLELMSIPVYGTDVHGTIQVVTDGQDYWVHTERSVVSHQSAQTEELQDSTRFVRAVPRRPRRRWRWRGDAALECAAGCRVHSRVSGRWLSDEEDQGFSGLSTILDIELPLVIWDGVHIGEGALYTFPTASYTGK